MLNTLKILTAAAAMGGLALAATPARADHVRFGIGVGVRPARVSTYVYPPPAYFSPTFVAPRYAAPVYVTPSYAQPGYYYTPPSPLLYPPTYYYGVAPYYPPSYYAAPSFSFSIGGSFGHGGGRHSHFGRR